MSVGSLFVDQLTDCFVSVGSLFGLRLVDCSVLVGSLFLDCFLDNCYVLVDPCLSID